MNDFRNENGLIDGQIPAGCGCPFTKECSFLASTCPTDTTTLSCNFSCGMARGFSITRRLV